MIDLSAKGVEIVTCSPPVSCESGPACSDNLRSGVCHTVFGGPGGAAPGARFSVGAGRLMRLGPDCTVFWSRAA